MKRQSRYNFTHPDLTFLPHLINGLATLSADCMHGSALVSPFCVVVFSYPHISATLSSSLQLHRRSEVRWFESSNFVISKLFLLS